MWAARPFLVLAERLPHRLLCWREIQSSLPGVHGWLGAQSHGSWLWNIFSRLARISPPPSLQRKCGCLLLALQSWANSTNGFFSKPDKLCKCVHAHVCMCVCTGMVHTSVCMGELVYSCLCTSGTQAHTCVHMYIFCVCVCFVHASF